MVDSEITRGKTKVKIIMKKYNQTWLDEDRKESLENGISE